MISIGPELTVAALHIDAHDPDVVRRGLGCVVESGPDPADPFRVPARQLRQFPNGKVSRLLAVPSPVLGALAAEGRDSHVIAGSLEKELCSNFGFLLTSSSAIDSIHRKKRSRLHRSSSRSGRVLLQ